MVNVYTITVQWMTYEQILNFKFKFYTRVIYLIVIVYTRIMYISLIYFNKGKGSILTIKFSLGA